MAIGKIFSISNHVIPAKAGIHALVEAPGISATGLPPSRERRLGIDRVLLALVAVALLLCSGCAEFGYYLQSIDGQLQLNAARRPVAEVIADPATAEPLKRRLERAAAIREFASAELKLPDNGSYRRYADVKRPFVVWNVFATEEFSLEPRRWCFPFAGCVGYRGYFTHDAAGAFAAGLRAAGLDVHVGGVPAYSTLGWFDDPLLNTFIHYPDYELARLIFHELAHQVVYVKGDSEFNESFAVAVETAGRERWLARYGDEPLRAAAAQAEQRRAQVRALMQCARERRGALYKQRVAPALMRERKAELFAQTKREYGSLKEAWGGFAGYDLLFDNLNNAQLASFSIYHTWLPALQRVFAQSAGDFTAFYVEVKRLAALTKAEREAVLAAP